MNIQTTLTDFIGFKQAKHIKLGAKSGRETKEAKGGEREWGD